MSVHTVHRWGGGGWCYPIMPCSMSPAGSPGPHPRGKWGGSGPGPHPRGKLRGIWSRPTPKGEVEGDLPRGCLLWGGVPGPRGCLLQGGACSEGVWFWGDAWWRPPEGYCCGWYASYWNAFLFGNYLFLNSVSGSTNTLFSTKICKKDQV